MAGCAALPRGRGEDTRVDRCNVVWTTPSENSWGSMPLGNGDIGLNVWVQPEKGLLFYIGKSDAWSENCRLLKLGRVRVALDPNPFADGISFRQELRLRQGEIAIQAGEGEQRVSLRVWVDANHPVIHVSAESERPFGLRAELEVWRTQRRELKGVERHSAYGLINSPEPVYAEPDVVVADQENRVVWRHRNERSIWADNLKLQGLGALADPEKDPLLHRTFGGAILGAGLSKAGDAALQSSAPAKRCDLSIHVLTAQTAAADEWLNRLGAQIDRVEGLRASRRLAKHRAWWKEFWARSWILADGADEARTVTQGYALQRFINACGGRGAFPIKFNGSIFTVDLAEAVKDVPAGTDADYRAWGGPYWFQNTRLPYWSMLASGDTDLMQPLFRMFADALPLAKTRARAYYGHDGAFFPETMYFWGTYADDNYGRDRAGKPDGLTDNRYIRYYWSGGLELSLMALDSFDHTRDREFAAETMLPLVREVIAFFDQHWGRGDDGKIRFDPAMSLETFHEAVDPLPEIVGIRAVVERLLSLPESMTTRAERANWQRLLTELPGIPMREADGEAILAPARSYSNKANMENPELYAVFPYRTFGLGKDGLELARRTFARRAHPGTGGWQQSAIQAALLGLTGEAARMVAANFATPHSGSRFPAFWGPNFDWVPDQDHGGVAMIALQKMLMQTDGGKILLFPAWPKTWDVEFKLRAPQNTTVEGVFRDGEVQSLTVTPPSRARDVARADQG